ncbi:DoxX-like family protein [Nitrincola nitratireducens]|uniref:DoxX-like family protein n=1 Tax=Nitrincola nitratireducens TaxID=1229521 RepID=UPI001ED9BA4F|nr:DoxX-like family protein [Nitrincola nitratireducens]
MTSEFFAKEIGYEVLAYGGIVGALADISILSGSVLDILIGIWLLLGKKLKRCFQLQMIVIVTYTLLLTAIDPSLWLHPFGPLTKNVPILVMIYGLYKHECSRLGQVERVRS